LRRPRRRGGCQGEESKNLFFEKKKQKTFVRLLAGSRPARATAQSLFASFSSEKEGLPFAMAAARARDMRLKKTRQAH
jgi:hypothetical protein